MPSDMPQPVPMIPGMGWLLNLFKPVTDWLYQARYGFRYTMTVRISSDMQVVGMWSGSKPSGYGGEPHLDIKLRIWSTGRGPDVTIIAIKPHVNDWYDGNPPGVVSTLLPKSGKPVDVNLLLYPANKQPVTEFKPGDTFKVDVLLSNDIRLRIKAKVT